MHAVVPLLRPAALLIAVLLPVAGARAQLVEDLRPSFQRETDPVRKARMFPRLGEAELSRVRYLGTQERYDDALAALEQYRDDAQAAHAALKSSGINADKKSNGFKQLQIHLRKSILYIGDTIAALPFERRAPFQEIQKQVEGFDKELIEMLFPRQPGRKPVEAKPRNQE